MRIGWSRFVQSYVVLGRVEDRSLRQVQRRRFNISRPCEQIPMTQSTDSCRTVVPLTVLNDDVLEMILRNYGVGPDIAQGETIIEIYGWWQGREVVDVEKKSSLNFSVSNFLSSDEAISTSSQDQTTTSDCCKS